MGLKQECKFSNKTCGTATGGGESAVQKCLAGCICTGWLKWLELKYVKPRLGVSTLT